jgi:hypothetical protein
MLILMVYLSVNVTYIQKDGSQVKVRGKVGDNVMYLAHRYNIPLEGFLLNIHITLFE